eukprot:TRINITY_DN9042_c0_g1_i1.p1 TRINITY_DN9042_c0_g1~~TRINITY_DN9042_c0_g1_i1.p1  ORF type:complete len:287 (+),score=44.51 TRINITY_DN9042_c0_g1_i1:142-1002(+)
MMAKWQVGLPLYLPSLPGIDFRRSPPDIAPIAELWALPLLQATRAEDGAPVVWNAETGGSALLHPETDDNHRTGVVRARREQVPPDGVRFVVPIHRSVVQFVLEARPSRNLRVIHDGVVQCETEDVGTTLRCTLEDDVTVECAYRRAWFRDGLEAKVNGVPVEGTFTDPLNILKAARTPAKGLVVLLLLRTFYNFFTFQHVHFSLVYLCACLALCATIYLWDANPKAGVLLALAIGSIDTAEALFWMLGHFTAEPYWLLGVQLLLVCARIALLSWVGGSLPLLSYL